MALSEEQIADLVVATLATYRYPLDAAWKLRGRLRQAGLCDPNFVLTKGADHIVVALRTVGYDRGKITPIIAPRLLSLMKAIDSGELEGLADEVASGSQQAFRERLERVKGVGPTCSQLAWVLMAKE